MATKKFEDILANLQEDQAKLLQQRSVQWYLKQLKQLVQTTKTDTKKRSDAAKQGWQRRGANQEIQNAAIKVQTGFSLDLMGKMIFYQYDPKLKKTLPYYDIFPLVIPLIPSAGSKFSSKSILGLNMHYLPPFERAKFMTILYTLINNTEKLDERTRLNVRYKVLKGASRFKAFRPCIKRYLVSHVRSRITLIHPEFWDNILMLPVAKFMKKNEFAVWADSIKMINASTGKKRKK